MRVYVPESWVTLLEQQKQRLSRQRRAGGVGGAEVIPPGRPAAAPQPGRVPLFQSSVEAGFPSPAEDFIEGRLDFNELLIQHAAATFCVRVTGHSMGEAIRPGDILVVDRSIEPQQAFGKVVIAAVNGELTVKRLVRQGEKVLLQPDNPQYAAIELTGDLDTVLRGVVTGLVRHAL